VYSFKKEIEKYFNLDCITFIKPGPYPFKVELPTNKGGVVYNRDLKGILVAGIDFSR
jgi:hypothetical protein